MKSIISSRVAVSASAGCAVDEGASRESVSAGLPHPAATRDQGFWAETPEGRGVKRVEVHAMIELGSGPFKAAEQTDFRVAAVLKDLRSYRD